MADYTAEAEVVVDAPAERVWWALTDPSAISEYWFGAQVTSDWQQGSPISWKGDWKGTPYEDHGTVVDAQPGKKLVMTHFSPLSGQPDVPENYHTITIDLTPEGDGTRVHLAQDKNATEEARKDSQQNWEMMLGGIKRVAERTTADTR